MSVSLKQAQELGMSWWILFGIILTVTVLANAQQHDRTRSAAQNPSPMADQTRAHERIPQQKYPGLEFKIFDLLPQSVDVFITQSRQKSQAFDLLLHFHGASVDAILLLDGIHADYLPERRVLAEGGQIDSSDVAAFIRFARAAAWKTPRNNF